MDLMRVLFIFSLLPLSMIAQPPSGQQHVNRTFRDDIKRNERAIEVLRQENHGLAVEIAKLKIKQEVIRDEQESVSGTTISDNIVWLLIAGLLGDCGITHFKRKK